MFKLMLVDSEVAFMRRTDQGLAVHFAAASVWQVDQQGRHDQAGYLTPLVLHLDQITCDNEAALSELGALSHGHVLSMGQRHTSLMLPWHCHDLVTVVLSFKAGAELTLTAQAGHCKLGADSRFMPSMAC